MKVKYVEIRVVLFFMFIIRQITAKNAELTKVISSLNAKNINPLLVVLGTRDSKHSHTGTSKYAGHFPVDSNSADQNDLFFTGDDGSTGDGEVYENDKDQAKYLLYNYLLRTGSTPKNTEEEIEEDKKNLLRSALRARCQARVECEKKCGSEEKPYCPVNCKAVFDSLNLCEPPKKKKPCKNEDPCEKRGKTLPPGWSF